MGAVSLALLCAALIAAVPPQQAVACPTVCKCIGQARVSVYCDFRGLEKVPINIPTNTTHLYLMGNKFTQVVPEMFLGYVNNSDGTFTTQTQTLSKLKVIRLDLNPVAIVNEHAFDSAPSLKFIGDMHQSYLPFDVKIQRQAFAEMKTDKLSFDGYDRVKNHPLEDPHFAAFVLSAS